MQAQDEITAGTSPRRRKMKSQDEDQDQSKTKRMTNERGESPDFNKCQCPHHTPRAAPPFAQVPIDPPGIVGRTVAALVGPILHGMGWDGKWARGKLPSHNNTKMFNHTGN
jgi:hypothetical protein